MICVARSGSPLSGALNSSNMRSSASRSPKAGGLSRYFNHKACAAIRRAFTCSFVIGRFSILPGLPLCQSNPYVYLFYLYISFLPFKEIKAKPAKRQKVSNHAGFFFAALFAARQKRQKIVSQKARYRPKCLKIRLHAHNTVVSRTRQSVAC